MLKARNHVASPTTVAEAHEIEALVARCLRLGDRFRYVAGVDVAYSRDDKWAYAVATVLSTTNWSVIHTQKVKLPVTHPYDPDMLGFREAPLMVAALTALALEPDFILVDGDGIAHPRGCGPACHVGYTLDFPTIGIAKTWPRGCGRTHASVSKKRGSKLALQHETSGEKLGFELHVQDNAEPVYVSPGHRVSVDDAVSIALRCTPWFKAPEPLRQAEQLANAFRDEEAR